MNSGVIQNDNQKFSYITPKKALQNCTVPRCHINFPWLSQQKFRSFSYEESEEAAVSDADDLGRLRGSRRYRDIFNGCRDGYQCLYFTVGKVKRPDTHRNDSNEVKNIIPNQKIENTGNNDVLVFLQVEVGPPTILHIIRISHFLRLQFPVFN